MSPHILDRRAFFLAFLGYLTFVVYGSLVPFQIRPHTFGEAVQIFSRIGYLSLGAASRADWIANIVLYAPLTFLGCGWAMGMRSLSPLRHVAALLILAFCLAVAVAVEFTQIFFAPRTVSLNDLLAETLGSLGGVALFGLGRWRIVRWVEALVAGGRGAVMAVAALYALLYVALSLFPYDFVISGPELAARLASGNQGWLLACGGSGWRRCAAHQASEVLALMPLGVLLALAAPALGWRRLFLIGAGLGLGLELAQLLLVSGLSQGLSLVWRGLGMMAGAAVGHVLRRYGPIPVARLIRRAVPFVALPYLVLLAGLNGWFSAPWLPFDAALARLAAIRFIPFYYHYFTTETAAMVSVLAQAGMYAPVGFAVWAFRATGAIGARSGGGMAVVGAALLATPLELGGLWLPSRHPDLTDPLIAAAAAGLAYGFLVWLFAERLEPIRNGREWAHPEESPHRRRNHSPWQAASRTWGEEAPDLSRRRQASLAAEPLRLTAAHLPRWIFLAGAAASLWGYPLAFGWPLLLGLAVVLWRWRDSWLIVVPAALPWLDFSYLTGRMYWSEFNTLLLIALATTPVAAWRIGSLRHPERLALGLFAASGLLSLALGLWPAAPLDANAFTHYTTSYNALRAVQGLALALAFWPRLRAEWRADPDYATDRLVLGMVLGVAAELAYVLWERAAYPGLWEFETGYRITGTFPGMHVGGAAIEAYLGLALPFVWLWAWRQRRAWVGLAAGGLYAVGAYGVMVTFSRGGQAAFGLATLLAMAGFARLHWWADRGRTLGGLTQLLALALGAVLVAWPVLSGKFSQSRLATIETDLGIRVAHWRDALAILDQAGNPVLGAGLGSFPAAFYWYSSTPSRPATYGFGEESGNQFLRLGTGEALYFEQVVPVEPGRDYLITMDVRFNASSGALVIPLCEKALLYSFTCLWNSFQPEAGPDQWAHYQLSVKTDGFGPPGSAFPRQIKLSLFNQRAGTVADVDNVALIDDTGQDLIRNGDFSDGMRGWFFSTDSHLAWHAKSLFVHVLFEQGWLGLAAFVAFLALTLGAVWRRSGHDPLALTLAIALSAFLIIGLIDSLIDEPRLGFLFFLLLWVASASCRLDDSRSQRSGTPRSFRRPGGRMG